MAEFYLSHPIMPQEATVVGDCTIFRNNDDMTYNTCFPNLLIALFLFQCFVTSSVCLDYYRKSYCANSLPKNINCI